MPGAMPPVFRGLAPILGSAPACRPDPATASSIIRRPMAVPKRKTSKARRDKRRATHRLSAPILSTCPQCHRPVRSHHVCRHCGPYRGREVQPLEQTAP